MRHEAQVYTHATTLMQQIDDINMTKCIQNYQLNTGGAKGGAGGYGSRFMRGRTAISHFTSKKLVISRNLMNPFLTV